MLPKLSELPKIPLVIVIFIGIIAIETLALTVLGLLFNVNLGLHGPNWIMLSIAVGLSGWLLTLGVYLFISALTDVPRLDATQSTDRHETHYTPSEVAYKYILWALVALAEADGAISEEKLVWIEAFHTQWIGKGLGRYYTQIYNDSLGRDIIINIARSFRTNGPHRIVDILVKNKIALTMHDREILLKLCCLLATLDGPMSTNETWLVIEIASAVDISEKRLLNF